jgi:S-formylglutathione hydrolase
LWAFYLTLSSVAGSGDGFLEVQLKPEAFQAAADAAGFPVTMRMQEGYDHRCVLMGECLLHQPLFHW